LDIDFKLSYIYYGISVKSGMPFLVEKTEVYIAVIPVRCEMRMCAEIVFGGMFQHKKSIFLEEHFFKNQIRNFFQLFEFVGRIGEYQIEFIMTTVDEFKYIRPEKCKVIDI